MKNLFPEGSGGILVAQMADFHLEKPVSESFMKEEDDTDVFIPTVHGNTYRINLKPGRLFCCSETGIKFMVNSPKNIEYKLEYGEEYINKLKEKKYELVGPLFNIKVDPDVVAFVYLPHYVCLPGLNGDTSIIKCGHFKDGKLNLLTPMKIESSYIVLEKPCFSCVAALAVPSFFWRKKPIPLYGSVLLYCRVLCPNNEQEKEYRTHMYLVFTNQPELKNLDKEKKSTGFKRIDKPSETRISVYTGRYYKVKCQNNAAIEPENLQFKADCKTEHCSRSEINVTGKVTSISLSLASTETQENQTNVWSAQLTRGDLEELSQNALKQLKKEDSSEEHFVIRHRQDLIQKITAVAQVTDGLRTEKLLTKEQCDNVKSKATNQEKMRELYNHVDGWGEEHLDVFYKILKKHHGSVIKNL